MKIYDITQSSHPHPNPLPKGEGTASSPFGGGLRWGSERLQIHDISLTIHPSLPTWPGDPKIKLERISKIEDGADANVTHISAGVHIGTHVDAPYHFLGGDAPTVERLPLDVLTGPAEVIHCPDVGTITADVLRAASIPAQATRLLFKTRNSELWARGETEFQQDFVALSADAAEYLVEHGIKLVGVDYLSVAPFHESVPTHRILLEAGVIAVEGLDLSGIKPGSYMLYCLPLKIQGSDGAPARAILIE
ncbi:MAG: cyclase family protein [Chloroflexota bacterium]|nr:cyclase family protein [Chloroflexota bacterium]